jgi:hypothetical protein
MKKYLILFTAAVMSLSSCMIGGTRGSGHVITQIYNQSDFKNIDISSVMKVYLTQGDHYSIKIQGEDNILDLMEMKKDGDKLSFGFKNNTNVSPTKDILIYITAPDFHKLEASGAGGFVSEGTIKANEILVDMSGATKVKLDVDAQSVKVDASGASVIVLSGNTNTLSVDGSGSMDVKAFDLKTQQTYIDISGAGTAKVQVEKTLKVDISGAGDVMYKGNPVITKEVHGAGTIKSAN